LDTQYLLPDIHFVSAMVAAENKNLLDEVVGSTLLGSPDYITFIKIF